MKHCVEVSDYLLFQLSYKIWINDLFLCVQVLLKTTIAMYQVYELVLVLYFLESAYEDLIHIFLLKLPAFSTELIEKGLLLFRALVGDLEDI